MASIQYGAGTPPIVGATRRCPVKPTTAQGHDQVNVFVVTSHLVGYSEIAMAPSERSCGRKPHSLTTRYITEVGPDLRIRGLVKIPGVGLLTNEHMVQPS
jgi:hypothetical protein